MQNKEINILLTSIGRRSYIVKYFKEALNGRGNVHVCNSHNKSAAFAMADYAVVSPLIYSDEYIPFLLNYCKCNEIKAVISFFDADLPVLAKCKKEFEEIGVKVIVSDIEVIRKCNDKWESYKFLKNKGFIVPQTFISISEAINQISQNKINYPVIIKPRWGMGSIAVYEAENEEELKVFFRKTQREIARTYLRYETGADIDNSVVIQEKILGQEYGLDVINDLAGNYQNTICKMKYSMRSGETDCAIVINDTNLKSLGQKISSSLKHIGNLDVDVFLCHNIPVIIEMNARFGGGYPFSHSAGVNLPKAIVSWLVNDNTENLLFEKKFDIIAQKDINVINL